jgi:hypothetical protein
VQLQGKRKEKSEKQCKDPTAAINDEDSMMGRRMLGHLDNRLRQDKTPLGYQNVPLGGVSLILVGDEGQLPPVLDKPKFDDSKLTTDMGITEA